MRMQFKVGLGVFTLVMLCLPHAILADRFLLEVEEFDGPWRKQTNISGYHGAGFCTSNANPKVADSCMKTSVEIAEPGEYAVFVRGYTSDNSRRAMQVEVNNKKLDVTQKGERRRWSWEKAGTVTLPKGKISVVVHDAADGFESADCVLLTNDPDDDPVAFEAKWLVFGGKLPNSANALRYNIDRCLEHCKKHADPKSKEEWVQRRTEVEAAFNKAMGYDPAPAKTPLNPQITGTGRPRGLYDREFVVRKYARILRYGEHLQAQRHRRKTSGRRRYDGPCHGGRQELRPLSAGATRLRQTGFPRLGLRPDRTRRTPDSRQRARDELSRLDDRQEQPSLHGLGFDSRPRLFAVSR